MLHLEKSKHWQKLQQLAVQYRATHLRELFANEGNRFDTYSIELPNLLLDYSKNCLTPNNECAVWLDTRYGPKFCHRTDVQRRKN